MLVSRLRQRLTIPTVLVRAIGVSAALFLLLVLVVGCGGQSSTESPAPEPEPKSEPKPESRPSKRVAAVEEGSLRDLVQERVGDFELQEVVEFGEEALRSDREAKLFNVVEGLIADYVRPGGISLSHTLSTTRSPEGADAYQRYIKDTLLRDSTESVVFSLRDERMTEVNGLEIVDERPVEANGEEVGTLIVMQGYTAQGEPVTLMSWNNGNLRAAAAIKGERDAAESFYESVPY